jgi:hypothetical protein
LGVLVKLILEPMTIEVREPRDSGDPTREPYAFVDELIDKLVAAEMRAMRAEQDARFNAMLAVVIMLSSAAVICMLGYLLWKQ